VEKELNELRERLANVEEWKRRRQEIDDELSKVWMDGGEVLPPPAYAEIEKGEENAPTSEESANISAADDESSANLPKREPSEK
jgi:ATP-binding cassette subfamily D (ALD) long-chain fatty acid import protein